MQLLLCVLISNEELMLNTLWCTCTTDPLRRMTFMSPLLLRLVLPTGNSAQWHALRQNMTSSKQNFFNDFTKVR